MSIAGRTRRVVFLAHPSARASHYPKSLEGDSLKAARTWLAQVLHGDRARKFRWEADDIVIEALPESPRRARD
jgi:hypothetical protein